MLIAILTIIYLKISFQNKMFSFLKTLWHKMRKKKERALFLKKNMFFQQGHVLTDCSEGTVHAEDFGSLLLPLSPHRLTCHLCREEPWLKRHREELKGAPGLLESVFPREAHGWVVHYSPWHQVQTHKETYACICCCDVLVKTPNRILTTLRQVCSYRCNRFSHLSGPGYNSVHLGHMKSTI